MIVALLVLALALAAVSAVTGHLWAENRRLGINEQVARREVHELADWARNARAAVAARHGEVLDDLADAWTNPTIRNHGHTDG